MKIAHCPCCGSRSGEVFYQVENTPANSCLLIAGQQEARDFPCGILDLACCGDCGFVWNASFDPRLIEYSERYEETQGFSPTFGRFHRQLALDLIERFGLRGKRVLEIGCGKGEFLALLCELGGNHGIGFDPAYRPGRVAEGADRQVTFITDLYSERYAHIQADFICCKMTLEHIAEPQAFVRMLRRATGEDGEVVVFILVPDGGRIIEEGAFEDFYYEHCSYFSMPSLRRLFAAEGFSIHSVESVYGGQYLALTASPRPFTGGAEVAVSGELAPLLAAVKGFAARCSRQRQAWHQRLSAWQQQGALTVIWGSGSKAVGFLTAVDSPAAVSAVVDINPHKKGTFMPGSGLPIIAPASLCHHPPDQVIVMNDIYRQEITAQLLDLGMHPQVLTLREQSEDQGGLDQ